jgi:hypothetical protein
MKLYEEFTMDKDKSDGIIRGLVLLIRFFKSKHSIGLKVTIGILVSLGLSSILVGIMKSLSKEENCNKIKDSARKNLCKKTLELKYTNDMIRAIDRGISKLDHRKADELDKINHLKKDRVKLVTYRGKLEKEYHTALTDLNKRED